MVLPAIQPVEGGLSGARLYICLVAPWAIGVPKRAVGKPDLLTASVGRDGDPVALVHVDSEISL